MYVAPWIDDHRPLTWATDDDVAQPTQQTMGRVIAKGVKKDVVVEPVSYHWYDLISHLVTHPPTVDTGHEDAINAAWRAMHADNGTIDKQLTETLVSHKHHCRETAYTAAHRLLAAMPEVRDAVVERVVHGVIVAAEAQYTEKQPSSVAEAITSSSLGQYDESTVEELGRIASPVVDSIFVATGIEGPQLPTFCVETTTT